MFYAYILQSLSSPDHFHHGHSADLKQRLSDHDSGHCSHTTRFMPRRAKFYAAFETLEQAHQFKQYLKTGSGHAFAQGHLLRMIQPDDGR